MREGYTPHEIAQALRGEGDDAEAILDVELNLPRLPRQLRDCLREYQAGYGPEEAGKRSGAANGNRRFNEALRRLTDLVNGN